MSGYLYLCETSSCDSLGVHNSYQNGDIPVLSFLLYLSVRIYQKLRLVFSFAHSPWKAIYNFRKF